MIFPIFLYLMQKKIKSGSTSSHTFICNRFCQKLHVVLSLHCVPKAAKLWQTFYFFYYYYYFSEKIRLGISCLHDFQSPSAQPDFLSIYFFSQHGVVVGEIRGHVMSTHNMFICEIRKKNDDL